MQSHGVGCTFKILPEPTPTQNKATELLQLVECKLKLIVIEELVMLVQRGVHGMSALDPVGITG